MIKLDRLFVMVSFAFAGLNVYCAANGSILNAISAGLCVGVGLLVLQAMHKS